MIPHLKKVNKIRGLELFFYLKKSKMGSFVVCNF